MSKSEGSLLGCIVTILVFLGVLRAVSYYLRKWFGLPDDILIDAIKEALSDEVLTAEELLNKLNSDVSGFVNLSSEHLEMVLEEAEKKGIIIVIPVSRIDTPEAIYHVYQLHPDQK